MKFIIDFKNDLSEQEITNYITSVNGTVVKTFQLAEKTFLVDCPSEPTFDASIHEHIINDDEHHVQLLNSTVIFDQTWGTTTLAGPTVTISTTDNNDWWKNYVIKKPKFDEPSYTVDRKGTGYVVYIMDSGCDISHPDFVGRPISNLFSFNGNFTDTNGHGTGLASVITGNTCGISNATVKVVKIFQNDTPTKQSDMVNALDAIYNDFIQNDYENAVINCSWTINKNTFIESKFQILHNMGCVIVAAAGNNGTPIEDVTPASMHSAITIGSYNQDLQPCDFSNYTGSAVSVTQAATNHGALDGWAPGIDIYVALINNGYGLVAGTSISTAIQSAVIAYNLTTYALSVPRNLPHNDFVSQSSLSRLNILDLSDPKYANSKNAIATVHTEVADVSNGQYASAVVAYSQANFSQRICDPRSYKRLEIHGDLPAGLTVNKYAMFGGGPAQTVTEVTTVTVPFVLIDNEDKEFPFNFKIVTVPNEWNYGDPTNDPTLDLMLQGSCSFRDCANPSCNPNCGAFICSQFPDKSCGYGVGARCECYF